jgi:hypothetical protein
MKVEVKHLNWKLAEVDQMLHAKITISAAVGAIIVADLDGWFEKVADVEVDQAKVDYGISAVLEDVFRRTNHIEEDWTQGDGIDLIADRARSSSVGDVFTVDGRSYVVAGCGFEEIGLLV